MQGPLTSILWGHLKQFVYVANINNAETLSWGIVKPFNTYVDIFERVCQSMIKWVHARGGHFEHSLWVAVRYDNGLLAICLYSHFTFFWCQESTSKLFLDWLLHCTFNNEYHKLNSKTKNLWTCLYGLLFLFWCEEAVS